MNTDTKDFQWDDEKVREFIIFGRRRSVISDQDMLGMNMKEFKASYTKGRDWEIVQMKGPSGDLHEYYPDTEKCFSSCKKDGCSIHSVKRLSDDSIWQIDDIDARWGKIESFVIVNDRYLNAVCNDGNPKPIYVQLMELKKAPPKKQDSIKPPIGIIPEWLWKERRLKEIREAIKRYVDAKLPVGLDWIVEEYTLREWIEYRNEDKKQPGGNK